MTAVWPQPFDPFFRMEDGSLMNTLSAQPQYSTENNITAHAGGTKAAAYVLSATISKISTVATTNDSVLAPPAIAGRTAIIINEGANTLAVYGAGTDTINDVATATLTSIAPGVVASLHSPAQGKWYVSSGAAGGNVTFGNLTVTGLETVSANGAVSAAGTNQTTATLLAANINNVATAAASTGVRIPAAVVGQNFYIFNKGANDIKVYGSGSDTIDGTAGATGVTLGHTAGTNSCIFFCIAAATFVSAKLGAVSS